jgi:hypothetical protein
VEGSFKKNLIIRVLSRTRNSRLNTNCFWVYLIKKIKIKLEVLFAKIRRYAAEKSINIGLKFKKGDKEGKGELFVIRLIPVGFVSALTFSYILVEECLVDPLDAEKLRSILDPKGTGLVPYEELVKMLADPQYFEKLFLEPIKK